MTKGSPLQRSCRQPPGTRAWGLRASSPSGCVAECVEFKGWVSRCDPGGHTERRGPLEEAQPPAKKKKNNPTILSFCAGGQGAGVNREKRPPQARQELQGAKPGGDLPETPAAPLPDPEAATGSMPSDEFPGLHSHLGRGPPCTQHPGEGPGWAAPPRLVQFSPASGHGCLLCARLHGAGVASGARGLKGPQCRFGSVHDSICQRPLAPLPMSCGWTASTGA